MQSPKVWRSEKKNICSFSGIGEVGRVEAEMQDMGFKVMTWSARHIISNFM
jgi:hypothetical protein